MATSIGVPGSATYAELLSGLEPMLNLLPDNSGNEISARDMRDVVFTLYQDVIGPSGGSFSEFVYTDTPANVAVGGVPVGQVFASMSLFTIFNKLFHKDFDPSASLQFVGLSSTILDFKQQNSTEYPQNTGFDEEVSFSLRWTATKATYDFQPQGTIVRNPLNSPPDPNPLFTEFVPPGGGTNVTPLTKPRINQSNSYTFACRDTRGVLAQSSVSLTYGRRYFVGEVSTRNLPNSSQIRDLSLPANNGGQSISGNFATTFRGSYTNHGGSNRYLIWCFPTSFGTPRFFQFTTQLWLGPSYVGEVNYRNLFGFEEPYAVWITQDRYNSPVAAYTIN